MKKKLIDSYKNIFDLDESERDSVVIFRIGFFAFLFLILVLSIGRVVL